MKRILTALAALAIAFSVLTAPVLPAAAQSVTTTANASAFPLSSNILFAARSNGRIKLECYNPTTNGTVTLTFASGFTIPLVAGAYYLMTAQSNLRGRIEDGAITATGTGGQTVQCVESYLQ